MAIQYAYDGDRIIAEYDANDALLRKFVYGPGIDEPICLIDVADANARYFYHFDGLGSVVALCDVNNVPVERYAYDVFGRPTIRDVNGVVLGQSAYANPYLFTGRAYDAETALYYYRARYYDYFTGRFLQPDPTGYADGLNLYSYCANNPIMSVDPLGLAWYNDWHYSGRDARNKNVPPTLADAQAPGSGFVQMPDWMVDSHDNGVGKREKKFCHPDGREAIYDGDTGQLVTQSEFRGTFNYIVPKPQPNKWYDYYGWEEFALSGLGHLLADWLPYQIWGNDPPKKE